MYVGDALEAALGTLRKLRRLDLRFSQQMSTPALTSLTALQRLRGLTFVSLGSSSDRGIAAHPLPGGAWLRRLRTLWTQWDVLAESAPVLAADATALAECRTLGLVDSQAVSRQAWDAFWHFAREHPPLRRLYLDGQTYLDGGMYSGDRPWNG